MSGTILRTAGIPGGTGGNLDVPLSELLAEDSPDAVHAVELSSFQLESVENGIQELSDFHAIGGRAMVDSMPCDAGRNVLKLAGRYIKAVA